MFKIKGLIRRIRHNRSAISRMKLLLERKRIRLLVKQAIIRGNTLGWEKASKIFDQKEAELRESTRKEIESINLLHKNEIQAIREEHTETRIKLESEHNHCILAERKELQEFHQKEILAYQQQYEDRCKRNDKLREDAINQANIIKESAQEAERYWRSQILKINEFLSASMSVVRTIADRYEYLQNSIGKVQVGKDMVEDLQKAYKGLVKEGHKDAPPIIGTE